MKFVLPNIPSKKKVKTLLVFVDKKRVGEIGCEDFFLAINAFRDKNQKIPDRFKVNIFFVFTYNLEKIS